MNTHPSVINLLEELQLRIPESSSGTYNKADPTHYEKGTLEFNQGGKDFMIAYNDCTWGVEFELYLKPAKRRLVLLSGIYLSRGFGLNDPSTFHKRGKWIKGTFNILHKFVRDIPVVPEKTQEYWENHEPDPWGCLADYE